mgnify:CR=1 FL=1
MAHYSRLIAEEVADDPAFVTAVFEAAPMQPHFPDIFEALRPSLAATPPGRVVLIAAGWLSIPGLG